LLQPFNVEAARSCFGSQRGGRVHGPNLPPPAV
jgi:hypothetical protein